MRASFAIATGGVLTLFIAAPSNDSSGRVRIVDEVSGAIFEQEFTADLPAATQLPSPRLFLNSGATAAAVAALERLLLASVGIARIAVCAACRPKPAF